MGHDNEWTVATLKAYFEALRREDQRALELLGMGVRERLDNLSRNFDELKSSVDQFHSAFMGSQKHGDREWLRIVNVATILAAIGTIIIAWVRHL